MSYCITPYVQKYCTKSNSFYDYCMICVLLKLALTDTFCVKFLLALTIDH